MMPAATIDCDALPRAEGAAPIADVAVVVDTPHFRELLLDVLAIINRAQNAAR